MPNFGVQPLKDRRWPTQIKLSGINAPAEQWVVDPSLPPLGTDPRYPTLDQIVIPRGRILAVRPAPYNYGDYTVVTMADGVSNRPIGYTQTNILRKHEQHIQWPPVVVKQEFIELPYIATVNDAYGQLQAGDRVTAYFGSMTSTTPNPMDRGRIVKWLPRRQVLLNHGSAATTIPLTAAVYPAFQPTVVATFNASGALVVTSVTLSWNSSAARWEATFGTAVQYVLYEFGQHADQIVGEVVRLQRIDQAHLMQGWLQWVTDNFAQWDYPPLAIRVPTSDVNNETPSVVVAGQQYRLLNRPVAFWKPIKVEIQGSYVNEEGNTISSGAGWLEMPLGSDWVANWSIGKYHSIDPWTGMLFFAGNVTVTAVRVSYSYETSYRDGRLWASGQIGLTDGSGGSGIVGMPPHLDVPNVAGAMRVIIY